MPQVAGIYERMAEIKRHAASLADKGRWDDIDWSEYEKLDKELINILNKNKHKK